MSSKPDRLCARYRGAVNRLSGTVVGAVVLAAVASALVGCGGAHSSAAPSSGAAPSSAKAPQLHGLVPEPLPQRPSFTLTDTSGRPFSFAARTKGKLTYLFFGYTHCPDVCPTTMGDIAYALRVQRPGVRQRVDVVFVTVDPRRDTGPVLRTWLSHYNRAFIGLTGSIGQIEAAERAAGIPLAPPEKHTGKNYGVTHSSLVVPYSPDGLAHVVYTQGFRPGDYAHDMPLLLGF
jgi:protein SCO1/2